MDFSCLRAGLDFAFDVKDLPDFRRGKDFFRATVAEDAPIFEQINLRAEHGCQVEICLLYTS